MKPRKVILTIEVETDLPLRALKDISQIAIAGADEELYLGTRDAVARSPSWHSGTICQVQANAVTASR